MADRYFVEEPISGPSARLQGAEAHHLAHVMRASTGSEVILFDGSGAEFTARVERVGRAEIELAILSRAVIDREPSVAITLAVAVPKPDRARWLIEKGVELGVRRVVPLLTERSSDRHGSGPPEKLLRAVIEASKQCGRNRLMEIAPPRPLGEFLAADTGAGTKWIAHPSGRPLQQVLDELPGESKAICAFSIAIGPEGGFTDEEIQTACVKHWQPVALGPRILRVETAALALVAAILLRWE